MNVRERLEKQEEELLSPLAFLSKNATRARPEERECELRTAFQRDRDRVIHCKSFRRLKHKTQVFFSPEGDHYRTRLTHTLEVTQIARTVARSLQLNEDLTEAIGLAHDLGHAPFGHVGERVLNTLSANGFRHYQQSVRVCDVIERHGGLNLTNQIRDGILNHSGDHRAATLEGRIIRFADRIAYINHDIDDAVRGCVISQADLPKACLKVLGDSHSKRINTLVSDLIQYSREQGDIAMSPDIAESMDELRSFLFDKVYFTDFAREQEEKAAGVLSRLYHYYFEHPDELPEELLHPDLHTAVCDFISCMTDRYALTLYQRLFIPQTWAQI